MHRNESQFPLAVRQGASAGEHKRKGNGAIGMAPRCDAPNPLYVLLPHAKTEPVEVSVKASWYPAPTAVTLVPEADQPGRGQTGYGHQTPQRNPAPPCWHVSGVGMARLDKELRRTLGHPTRHGVLSFRRPRPPSLTVLPDSLHDDALSCDVRTGPVPPKGGVEHVQNPHRSVPQRPRVRY